jgi:hypothetical protein
MLTKVLEIKQEDILKIPEMAKQKNKVGLPSILRWVDLSKDIPPIGTLWVDARTRIVVATNYVK